LTAIKEKLKYIANEAEKVDSSIRQVQEAKKAAAALRNSNSGGTKTKATDPPVGTTPLKKAKTAN